MAHDNATDCLKVTVGNIWIGTGSTPGTALDGDDLFVEGHAEIDGLLNVGGAATFLGTITATSATATIGTANITTLLDVDESVDVDLNANDEYVTISNSAEYGADGAQVTIENTDADVGAAMYLLRLRYTDTAQANCDFAVFEDAGGTDKLAITHDGGMLSSATIEAATLKATTLLDVDEAVDIDLNANDEEVRVDSTANDYAAGSGIVEVYDDSTGQTNASYLLRLMREADANAQDHFILCEDNSTGADANGDDMFKVDSGGNTTITGTLEVTGATTMTTNMDMNGDIVGAGPTTYIEGMVSQVEAYTGADNVITIAESGKTFTNTGDANGSQHTLPEASTAIGCEYTFIVTTAQTMVIELDDADVFLHLTLNAGDQIESATVNDSITVRCIDATNWMIVSAYPLAADWADGGP